MKSIIISLGFLFPITLNAQGIFSRLEVFAGPGSVREYGTPFLKHSNFKLGYIAGIGLVETLSSKFDLSLRFQYEMKGTKASIPEMGTEDMFNNPPTYNLPQKSMTYVQMVKTSYYTFSIVPRYHWKGDRLIAGLGIFYSTFGTSTASGYFIDDGQKKGKFTGSNNFYQTKQDFGFSIQIGYPIFESSGFKLRGQIVDNLGLHNTFVNSGSGYLDQKTNILALVLVVSPK